MDNIILITLPGRMENNYKQMWKAYCLKGMKTMDNVKDLFDNTFCNVTYHIGMMRAFFVILSAPEAEKHLDSFDNAMWSFKNNCVCRWVFGNVTRYEEWSKKDIAIMDKSLKYLANVVSNFDKEKIDITILHGMIKSIKCMKDSFAIYKTVFDETLKGNY